MFKAADLSSPAAGSPAGAPVKEAGITLTSHETLTLELTATECLDQYRDIRVAVATPEIRLGDVTANEARILDLISEARQAGADLLLFSDLALTGRTCGHLFLQRTLQDACLESLARITRATADSHLLVLLSLPLRFEDRLFKATAIIYKGEIVGMTPAPHLSEEEKRWFSDPQIRDLAGQDSYACELITDAGDGLEEAGILELRLPPVECPTILRHLIQESLPDSPDLGQEEEAPLFSLCDLTAQNLLSFTFQFVNLCTVIPCLSVHPALLPLQSQSPCPRLYNFDSAQAADALAHGSIPVAAIADGRPEWTGHYRRLRGDLIRRSLADRCLILYAGAGKGESVSQNVYAGRRLIISDGRVLAEGKPYTTGLTLADLSADQLFRVRSNQDSRWDIRKTGNTRLEDEPPLRMPFLMRKEVDAVSLFEETLMIQAQGLADRLTLLDARPVLGLSGGLDSAMAFLVCLKAVRLAGWPPSRILAVFMPGPGTSPGARKLAADLAAAAGADYRVIGIEEAVRDHLQAIGYRGDQKDVTFENAQARERTQILMDLANLEGGLVVGTGDLSELALGWCTYNGDHMSMYAVNASLTKTVIQDMVKTAVQLLEKGQADLIDDPVKAALAAKTLADILARPVSPELLVSDSPHSHSQLTEASVGPYPLVDFFLWHLVFEGRKPSAVLRLAIQAFGPDYSSQQIAGHLAGFIRRFFNNQFKRSASPEGVGAFEKQLVPLSVWQMPGDARARLWLEELEAGLAGE